MYLLMVQFTYQLWFVKSFIKISDVYLITAISDNSHKGSKLIYKGCIKTLGLWLTWLLLYEEYSQFLWGLGLDEFRKYECPITHTFLFLKSGFNSSLFGVMPNTKICQSEGGFCFLTQHWETYIKEKKTKNITTRPLILLCILKVPLPASNKFSLR